MDEALRHAGDEPAPRRDSLSRRVWRLLGSMPFAVAILAVVAVAASLGSLVEQNQPFAHHVSGMGWWWARIYVRLGIVDVYRAPWFLALLALMTLSTGLCVWRQTPAMWREARSYRAHLGVRQLGALPHHRTLTATLPVARWRPAVEAALRRDGFQWQAAPAADAVAMSARKGMARRLGYVLTHLGIVVIGVGGLADGNLPLQWQRFTGSLAVAPMDASPASLPAKSRLDKDSGAFRGALRLAPGEEAAAVSLNLGDGQLLRELPVRVRLEHFEIATHPNGQPRDFISDIVVTDDVTGQKQSLRVSMNKPARHGALSFYQSGFDDGGTKLKAALLAAGGLDERPLDVQVGQTLPLLWEGEALRLEPTAWHPRNVVSARDAETVGLAEAFLQGRTIASTRDLGPSLALGWRDASGQVREQTVYRDPIEIDGRRYLVAGTGPVGQGGDANATFLRLPLDADGSLRLYQRTLGALRDPVRRAALLDEVTAPLGDSAGTRALRSSLSATIGQFMRGGFRALEVPTEAPEAGDTAQHERSRKMLVELLSRMALAAWRDAQPAGPAPDLREGLSFSAEALLGYSSWIDAGRPPLLRVDSVAAVDATVLQVTHAPGAAVVYLGMAMLGLGVVLMVLVPERRLWLRGLADGQVLIALAAHRPMPALADELEALSARLRPLLAPQLKELKE